MNLPSWIVAIGWLIAMAVAGFRRRGQNESSLD
jgi:hypothetical protein